MQNIILLNKTQQFIESSHTAYRLLTNINCTCIILLYLNKNKHVQI